jgi:uncharacterized phage protein gp47/JayE
MAFTVPTTQQVADTIVAQLEASLSQTLPLLPKAFSRVLAKAIAGVYVMLWRYAGFIFLQLFVAYASDKETTVGSRTFIPLVEWGRLVGVGDPVAATRAELVIAVDVETQGDTLPARSQLLRASTRVIYTTTAAVELDAPTVQVTIRASSDQEGNGGAGAIGNLETGDVVSFVNPLPGVVRDATVVSTSTTGSDAETSAAYRLRIIRKFRNRPQGGAYADYQQWGEEPAGILNVYPYTGLPGEMDIYVEATPESSGSSDGIPTSAQLQEVEDSIILDQSGLASRRPAGVETLNVYAITRSAFDVVISNLSPDTTETRSGVEDALTEYFLDREPFILGLSALPRKDRVSHSDVAGIVSSIVAAHGATISNVELQPGGGGSSIPIHALGRGEKAKLGSADFGS